MSEYWDNDIFWNRWKNKYKKLRDLIREYNMISKNSQFKKQRISKVREMKHEFYEIKQMEKN